VMGEKAAKNYADDKPTQDFVSDAFAHAKFIAYSEEVMAIFKAVGIDGKLDKGVAKLGGGDDAKSFIDQCGELRFWDRVAVKQD